MENVKDRRVKKTREAILSAFSSLLEEKSYSRITVRELAEKADISRKTFYLHYSSLEEVLKEFLEISGRSFIGDLQSSGFYYDSASFFMDPENTDYAGIFTFAEQESKKQKKLLSRLMNDGASFQVMSEGGRSFLLNLQKRYRDRYQVNPEMLDLIVAGIFYGFFRMYFSWSLSASSVSAEEFAGIIKTVLITSQKSLKELENSRAALGES